MFEVKQNARAWVPVRLFDSTGSNLPNVDYSTVDVLIIKADTTEAFYTVGFGADWVEHITAPFSGSGIYQLNLQETDTDVNGALMYVVKSPASRIFVGSIKVVANEEVDTFERVNAVTGTLIEMSASLRTEINDAKDLISGSIVNVSSSLRTEINDAKDLVSGSLVNVSASLGQQLTRARHVSEGNWKIFTTGPDSYKMIFYDFSGNVLFKHALTGSDGNLNFDSPFERNSTS